MKLTNYISSAIIALALASCSQFNEASDAPKVSGLDIDIDLNSMINTGSDQPLNFGDMTVKMDNYLEGLHYEQTFTGAKCKFEDVIPGIYTILVSGKGTTAEGTEFILAGSSVNSQLTSNVNLTVDIKGAAKGDLVFSEIYYCGSKPPLGFSYFRDQFYEIANNTDKVQYLDGLYFANTEPIDFDKVMPIWPESDGKDNYVYVECVWQIPGDGTGTKYPLQPGESVVLAQWAVNHQTEKNNPNSPVDCSVADFEFACNNVNFPENPDVEDMIHVYYNGSSNNSMMQYLTSVFGTAYIIFRVPEGVNWDPVTDKSLQAVNLADSWAGISAKVPVEYIVDAVECIRNPSYVDAKNIPAVADAGFASVGATYQGKGITRKLSDKQGANGAILYVDGNNTTEDFESGVVPVLHRHSKMVPWNHSLK